MKDKWYTKHLVEPSSEWVSGIAKIFNYNKEEVVRFLDDDALDVLEICELRRDLKSYLKEKFGREYIEIEYGIPQPDPVFESFPILHEVDSFVTHVTPTSLNQVKDLIGIPNTALARPIPMLATDKRKVVNKIALKVNEGLEQENDVRYAYAFHQKGLRSVKLHHLPTLGKIDFYKLQPDQKKAVYHQATNLIYGYADEEIIKVPPMSFVHNYVLEMTKKTPIFRRKNLVVCDGEKVSLKGFGALLFANIIIEGSGTIALASNMKLHAYQIKRIRIGGNNG